MKKILLVAAAGLGLAALSPAFAADGTISITGQVTASTCQINGGNSPQTVNVTLPTVSTTALNASGATAGNQPFAINLSGCGSATQATAYFEPGPTIDAATGNLKNATGVGNAANVQVRLLNSDFSEINLAGAAGSQDSQQVALSSGAGTLNYYAQYYATGAAGAGAVNTSVQFTMQYQ